MVATWEYQQAMARYTVLGELLLIREAIRRSFSLNEAGQSPKRGYEDAFRDEDRRLEIIRGMMREERAKADRQARYLAGAE